VKQGGEDDAIHPFDRDTALELVRRDASTCLYDARIDPGWWIIAGPSGGYLAAILLRSMMDSVDDSTREARTQTTHFTARAQAGPARIVTQIERSGRSLSTVSARLEQDGKLIALSLCALGAARESDAPVFQDARMPEVPPPERVDLRNVLEEGPSSEFRSRYELRPVFPSPTPQLGATAVTGGWIRLASPRPPDALLIAALADAWPPAVFQKLARRNGGRGVPTVELTVHFRAPEVVAGLSPDTFALVRFTTRISRDGFLEEDGEIWSEDGVLLAQSRQLALFA
jgi:acyl-CoA thioesterase